MARAKKKPARAPAKRAKKAKPKPAATKAAPAAGPLADEDKFGDRAWLASRRPKPPWLEPESMGGKPKGYVPLAKELKAFEDALRRHEEAEAARRKAMLGNKFWQVRTKHGRDKIFSAPEVLWEACVEWFEWVSDNPLYEDELVTFQGEVTHEPRAKMRAMTIDGLCVFLGIGYQTWRDYAARGPTKEDPEAQDFSEVTTRVEAIIRTQKFQGAAGGFLAPNIIARDLGLAEKNELSGRGGAPIETVSRVERVIVRAPKRKNDPKPDEG